VRGGKKKKEKKRQIPPTVSAWIISSEVKGDAQAVWGEKKEKGEEVSRSRIFLAVRTGGEKGGEGNTILLLMSWDFWGGFCAAISRRGKERKKKKEGKMYLLRRERGRGKEDHNGLGW